MRYGKHLMQDVILNDEEDSLRLANENEIKKILSDLIKISEMTLVEPVQAHQFPSASYSRNIPGGITAFGILSESHISIHTWPENNYFSLDLFSCRNFDEKKIESAIKKIFKVKKIDSKTVERGISVNFPKELKYLPRYLAVALKN
ncbi:MAG: adenosylmethionine decarboxylase [Parcubacteria group bacterium]|nr:adenosylmethionine decarboxylase [Parcubacteria group bacterium]